MFTQQNYATRGYYTTRLLPTAQNAFQSSAPNDERESLFVAQTLLTPFQAALLFTAEKQRAPKGNAAFVCYLSGKQAVAIERLHTVQGYNPHINLDKVIRQARRNWKIDGVILALWTNSTNESPAATEIVDAVEDQYYTLLDAKITLVDSLRLSETGVYSYYGDHNGPYWQSPCYHEKSICRLY